MASKRKQQQIDAMVKRLQDLAFPTLGAVWGEEGTAIFADQITQVIRDVHFRFSVDLSEEGTQIWNLFFMNTRLYEWQKPERIAEYLLDHGYKP